MTTSHNFLLHFQNNLHRIPRPSNKKQEESEKFYQNQQQHHHLQQQQQQQTNMQVQRDFIENAFSN